MNGYFVFGMGEWVDVYVDVYVYVYIYCVYVCIMYYVYMCYVCMYVISINNFIKSPCVLRDVKCNDRSFG